MSAVTTSAMRLQKLALGLLIGAACGLLACGAEDKSPSSETAKTSSASASPTEPPTPKADDAPDVPDKGVPDKGTPTATAGPNSLGPSEDGPPPRLPGAPDADGGRGGRKLAAIAELSTGTLDRDEVQRAIDASAGKFTPCLVAETRVRVRATITQTGDVADATVLAADPDDPKLRDCVSAAFRKVSFPKPKGSSATTLTVDLVLRPELKL